MSYCRWSSDGFRCDVYCYESVLGGWMTHVAARRYVHDDPCPEHQWSPSEDLEDPMFAKKLFAVEKAREKWLSEARLEPIGLPHDGADFNDPDPSSAADTLEMLRSCGYRVPQYAIDELREEAKDG